MDLAGSDGTVGPRLRLHRGAAVGRAEHRPFCKGIVRALVDTLTREIMRLGKVPFYCTAWSNIASKRTAISCGYRDAWVELSVKENAFTEKMLHHSEDNR